MCFFLCVKNLCRVLGNQCGAMGLSGVCVMLPPSIPNKQSSGAPAKPDSEFLSFFLFMNSHLSFKSKTQQAPGGGWMDGEISGFVTFLVFLSPAFFSSFLFIIFFPRFNLDEQREKAVG